MGSTNFLQWNPGQNNQENDAAWAADSQRTGGATNDEAFPSPTANKLFYQTSTGITALMQMMATKGFVVNDTNIATLASVLSALLTTADIRPNMVLLAFASTVVCNVGTSLGFEIPLNGNVTLTVTGAQIGDEVTFVFIQDGTGGRTVTWPSNFFGALQPDPHLGFTSSQQFKVETNGNFIAVGPVMSANASSVVNSPVGLDSPSTGNFITPSSSDNSTNAATTAWAKVGLSVTASANGFIKLPTWLGGLVIQWGTTGNLGGGNTPVTESFTTPFPTACFGVLAVDNSVRVTSGNVSPIGAVPISTSQFNINAQDSNVTAFWVAFGH